MRALASSCAVLASVALGACGGDDEAPERDSADADPRAVRMYDWEATVLGDPEAPLSGMRAAVAEAAERPAVPDGDNTHLHDRWYAFGRDGRRLGGPSGTRAALLASLPGGALPPGAEALRVRPGTVVLRADPEPGQPADRWFVLDDDPALDGRHMRDAAAQTGPPAGQPVVTFSLTPEGQRRFRTLTRAVAQRGAEEAGPGAPALDDFQHFAFVVDDAVLSRPLVSPVDNAGGIDARKGVQIAGGLTPTEARRLADRINAASGG